MRLQITFHTPHVIALPYNYAEYLTAAIYSLLGSSNAEYARFLHDEGYALADSHKTFKLFTHSQIRGRRIGSDQTHIRFAPDALTWFISSPVNDFIRHAADGLCKAGAVSVGSARLEIAHIEAVGEPDFTEPREYRFSCLSPMVVSQPLPEGKAYYVRPTEGPAFSDGVRRNLVAKYRAINGAAPTNDAFNLIFDPSYLKRDSSGGIKLISNNGINLIGAFAPFTASGLPELLGILHSCGGGKSNALGLGMVRMMDR